MVWLGFLFAFVPLIVAAVLVASQTIQVVEARHLLPRWDHAAHLVAGWTDHYYLSTFQWHRLAWDLWSQGYWPPGHALFQVPFYAALGGGLASGLWSSVAAFGLSGAAGSVCLARTWGRQSILPVALFVMFLATSPFALAYASVAMLEMLGVLMHACVFLAYAHDHRTRSSSSARWLALSLTATFFTKYNYFVLIAVPLVCHELMIWADGMTARQRCSRLWDGALAIVRTRAGALVAASLAVAAAIELTGGFAFTLAGQRVAFRSIGYTGHVALYGLLAWVWLLHRRKRIDWPTLWARDPRLRPLALWFGLPVVMWLASPYPNHIKDVVNLLVNTPMGPPGTSGLAAYLQAAAADYFADGWRASGALIATSVALLRWRRQPTLMRLLLLSAVLEFVLVAAHPTRDPRFLALPMLALWLASAGEIASWTGVRRPAAAAVAAVAVVCLTCAGVATVVRGEAFRRLAFVHYVESPALHAAFEKLRDDIGPTDRVAVLGRRDAVSPGLVRWQLGPPLGETSFPMEILREADVTLLDSADVVILVAPRRPELATPAEVADHQRDSARLRPLIDAGRLSMAKDLPIEDQQVTLRVYRRASVH